jgi:Arc/MetJ-type ribon-helix-helix transcriptional regulator
LSLDIGSERKALIPVMPLQAIMKLDDEDRDEEPEREDEGDDGDMEGPDRALASLKESILQIVEEALEEALQLRRKGHTFKLAMEDELGRIKTEVRKAVEGATATISAIDLSTLREGLKGRTNTLMTRVRDEDLKRMDLLVEAGLFESRSECAAFLIHVGLESRRDLIDKVEDTAKRIAELKEQLRKDLSGEP